MPRRPPAVRCRCAAGASESPTGEPRWAPSTGPSSAGPGASLLAGVVACPAPSPNVRWRGNGSFGTVVAGTVVAGTVVARTVVADSTGPSAVWPAHPEMATPTMIRKAATIARLRPRRRPVSDPFNSDIARLAGGCGGPASPSDRTSEQPRQGADPAGFGRAAVTRVGCTDRHHQHLHGGCQRRAGQRRPAPTRPRPAPRAASAAVCGRGCLCGGLCHCGFGSQHCRLLGGGWRPPRPTAPLPPTTPKPTPRTEADVRNLRVLGGRRASRPGDDVVVQVTDSVRASRRPSIVAPVFAVMAASAITVPTKLVLGAEGRRAADLPVDVAGLRAIRE